MDMIRIFLLLSLSMFEEAAFKAQSPTTATTDCPEPAPVANAWRDYQENQYVRYLCVDGYRKTEGVYKRHCNNVYNDSAPVCTLDCGSPRVLKAVTHNTTQTMSDTVVGYTCIDNYNPRPSVDLFIRCDPQTGKWEGSSSIMCKSKQSVRLVRATHSPDGTAGTGSLFPADLGIDTDEGTCSRTAVADQTSWTVHFNDSYDVLSIGLRLKLEHRLVNNLTLHANVNGGLVPLCGKLNATKVTLISPDIVTGIVYCATEPRKPDGNSITLTAHFDGASSGSLQVCDSDVRGAPTTDACHFPPRIPRLKVVTNQTRFVRLNTVIYECDQSYTALYGSGEVTCGLDLKWSSPSLVCTYERLLVKNATIQLSSDREELEVNLKAVYRVIGVSIDPGITGVISVAAELNGGSEKRCEDTVYNDTSLYVSCSQLPVANSVEIELLSRLDNTASLPTVRVFGYTRTNRSLECLQTDKGEDYMGTLNRTVTGLQCKVWANRSPHHNYRDVDFPDGSMAEAGNYCRNPAGSRQQPWCYVEGSSAWDLCPLYRCEQFCRRRNGADYKGSQEYTASRKRCLQWSSLDQPFVRPLDFSDVSTSHRFCRNPGQSQSRPWCFVPSQVKDTKRLEGEFSFQGSVLYYDHCDIPKCPTTIKTAWLNQSKVNEANGTSHLNAALECHMADKLLRSPSWSVVVSEACPSGPSSGTPLQGTPTTVHNTTGALCRHRTKDASGATSAWTRVFVICDRYSVTATSSITEMISSTTEQTQMDTTLPYSPYDSSVWTLTDVSASSSYSEEILLTTDVTLTDVVLMTSYELMPSSTFDTTTSWVGSTISPTAEVMSSSAEIKVTSAFVEMTTLTTEVMSSEGMSTTETLSFTVLPSQSVYDGVTHTVSSIAADSTTSISSFSEFTDSTRLMSTFIDFSDSLFSSDFDVSARSTQSHSLSASPTDSTWSYSLSPSATGATYLDTIPTPTVENTAILTTTIYPSSTQNIPTPSKPSHASKCRCKVGPSLKKNITMDISAVQEMTSSIYRELTVNPSNLSRTVRKKTSATDNRVSATAVGSLGVFLLCGTLGLITVSDIVDFWRKIRPANASDNAESVERKDKDEPVAKC